jgi:hypothetical protein
MCFIRREIILKQEGILAHSPVLTSIEADVPLLTVLALELDKCKPYSLLELLP